MKIKLKSIQRVVNSLLRPNFLKDFSHSYNKGFEDSLSSLNEIGGEVKLHLRRQK